MKKEYKSPFAEILRFKTEEILADSFVFIRPGEGSGIGGNDDETEYLPNDNVNGFH